MIERFLIRVCISAGGAPASPLAAHAHLATVSDVAVCVVPSIPRPPGRADRRRLRARRPLTPSPVYPRACGPTFESELRHV